MTFDDRYHLANGLQSSAWASLLLLKVIGAPASAVWAVLNVASLAVRPGLCMSGFIRTKKRPTYARSGS